jgi:serine/threonine-protein kinase
MGLRKPVVVKILREVIACDPGQADRLRLEAQTLASLESPHLVSVTDIGRTSDQRPFFVMERLKGRTLRQLLHERGVVPPADAVEWTIQVLVGLSAAHRIGVIHRDVKLDNVFLCERTTERGPIVKVLDFGIAKVLQSAALPFPGPQFATEEGALVGSPRYVSPEQVRFDSVDAQTDVYAVGVLLYTLLVGRGPFAHAETMLDLLNAHLRETPVPPSKRAAQHVPPELDRAVMKAMAKRPEARFESAELFAVELRRVADLLADVTLPVTSRRAITVPTVDDDAPTPLVPSRADGPLEQTTSRGTWIMTPAPSKAAPTGRAPALTPSAVCARGSENVVSDAEGESALLTMLPTNLGVPAARAPDASTPTPSRAPDRRTLAVVTLATAVFFATLFATTLHVIGVL